MPHRIEIDGSTLTLEDVERVATDLDTHVALAEGAEARMLRSRAVVERALAEGATVYGVTTGFGRLAETPIPPDRLEELQVNLIRSHACGVGAPLPRTETRAIMLLRANVLAKGFSGVRPVIVERLLDLLNRGVHPVIPEQGCVGASGDLAPLSHLALVLIGEGEAEVGGEVLPGARGAAPGGAGAGASAGQGGAGAQQRHAVHGRHRRAAAAGAERAVETAEVAGAMWLEGLRGHAGRVPSRASCVLARTPVRRRAPQRLRALLADSEIREIASLRRPARAGRVLPALHAAGARRRAPRAGLHRAVLETKCNSATDNPLIFPDEGRTL